MKRAVVLIVMDTQDRVLLLERSAGHDIFPGQWGFPGGKVDYIKREITHPGSAFTGGPSTSKVGEWEADDEACIRECIEETGYVPTLITDTGITATGGDQRFIVRVFRSLIPTEKESITREFPNREHQSFGFFSLESLPDNIGTLTKQIIRQVLG